mmetsp:Transcript_16228/g.24443  ORF Transcript_16228/g.24443 Transcript_16228/m.24443 type:complete len:1016 (-) Transcript_16228:108-3155(-)|eukprot:CAMPEP_0185033744 /NCGR_PEP_ID=MMETSP1103-20130426/23003_1 /TAXON_ID=36769 /ORGANISM="Paraphysomonas bandaiensis, Strain Caron Lab Isolate" /LENGTH=1015 /DNA_ID=CAMNT_0027570133 /DNA_START=45 /DNA_END=3092 /DNA_ORIENTATION=-
MADGNAAKTTIETDGISEEFFNLLWMKDELNFGPSINIPDTVIFKYGQPVTWYFTSSNGKIKKKNRNNLLNARIEDAFTKHVLGYDVIATFVSFATAPPGEKVDKKAASNTIEYMDRKAFQAFLYDRWESNNGILQRFIEPKGTKNETIRAIWSPKVCLLERAENIHHLHDQRYGLYERCVTYEGPEFYSVSAPLRGPVLAGQVQRICEAVVSHISEVTFAQSQVSRLVLNLKVDSRDKVWLLYTTSIRCCTPPTSFGQESVPNSSLVNIDSVLGLPPTVHLNPNRSYDKLKTKKEVRCVSCGNKCLEDLRHPMHYKTIIKHYEHVLHLIVEMSDPGVQLRWPPKDEIIEAAGGVGFGCLHMASADDYLGKSRKMDLTKPLESDELRIPPILRYIHPKLSAKSFQQCKKDPLFLYKTVTLCENCYLVYAEFTTMLLRVGQDLTKLFATTDGSVYQRSLQSSQSVARPSSADWRAMSSIHTRTKSKAGRQPSVAWSSHMDPSENHLTAKENAIGLRSTDAREQPTVPRSIRNESDSMELFRKKDTGLHSVSTVDRSASAPQLHSVSASASAVNQSYSQEDIRRMVAERERIFFKEIAKNPQLRDQHPLMHLITSQQKLSMADEASGVLTSKASQKSDSLFGSSTYGRQGDNHYDKFGVYKEQMKYIGKTQAAHTKEVKLIRQKSLSRQVSRSFSRGNSLAEKSIASQASSSTHVTGLSDTGDESAKKHAEFLRETLGMVQSMDAANAESTEEVANAGIAASTLKQKKGVPKTTPLNPLTSKRQHSSKNALLNSPQSRVGKKNRGGLLSATGSATMTPKSSYPNSPKGSGTPKTRSLSPHDSPQSPTTKQLKSKDKRPEAKTETKRLSPAPDPILETKEELPQEEPKEETPKVSVQRPVPKRIVSVDSAAPKRRPTSPQDVAADATREIVSAGLTKAVDSIQKTTLHRSGMLIHGQHYLTQLIQLEFGVQLRALSMDNSDLSKVFTLTRTQEEELEKVPSRADFVRELLEELIPDEE